MKVYKECCKNCLLSPDAIVSPERRRDILKECIQEQSHFICHKASIRSEDVCCKTFYEKFGHISQLVRIAKRLNAVEMVDQPESEKLISYREMEKTKGNE